LYNPPVDQPEYQASADNSYSVPSIYDIGKPGNFPSYNSIPAANDDFARAPETYGAPQEVYEVPIKVEETYKAAPQEKAPEVFYIFYENQEPATAAQVCINTYLISAIFSESTVGAISFVELFGILKPNICMFCYDM
jgi:hypothetical protein